MRVFSLMLAEFIENIYTACIYVEIGLHDIEDGCTTDPESSSDDTVSDNLDDDPDWRPDMEKIQDSSYDDLTDESWSKLWVVSKFKF